MTDNTIDRWTQLVAVLGALPTAKARLAVVQRQTGHYALTTVQLLAVIAAVGSAQLTYEVVDVLCPGCRCDQCQEAGPGESEVNLQLLACFRSPRYQAAALERGLARGWAYDRAQLTARNQAVVDACPRPVEETVMD